MDKLIDRLSDLFRLIQVGEVACILDLQSFISDWGISPNKTANEHCQRRDQSQNHFDSSFHFEGRTLSERCLAPGAFDNAFLDRVLFLVGGVVDESRQSDLRLRFREGDSRWKC